MEFFVRFSAVFPHLYADIHYFLHTFPFTYLLNPNFVFSFVCFAWYFGVFTISFVHFNT